MQSVVGRSRIGLWLLLFLMGSPPPLSAVGLLPSSISQGHGIALSESQIAAARALGEATRALDAADLEAAAKALPRVVAEELLSDYADHERVRLLLGRGSPAEAARLAAKTRGRLGDSELARQLTRLEGDALAKTGEEEQARVLWHRVLAESLDLEERRALRLSIIRSRQRSGELDPALAPETLLGSAFPEASLPAELPPGIRTSGQALSVAGELFASGRSAEAVAVYREALAGELARDDARKARFQLATALFRLREYDRAQAEFEALGDEPRARFWNARSQARRGRIDIAIQIFEELAAGGEDDLAIEAAYLAGSLLEDRAADRRAMLHYERVASHSLDPEQAQRALWRIGWSAWRRGEFELARSTFQKMSEREADELLRLRPRYWAARSAEAAGKQSLARSELASLAGGWKLSYYGWRAQQRLGEFDLIASADPELKAGKASGRIPEDRLQRIALLLEAGLQERAAEEIRPLLPEARSLTDRIRLGRLLAGAGDYHRAQLLAVEAYSPLLGKGLRSGFEKLFWLSWPPAYRELVETSLPATGRVEAALVWAIMREESSFRPRVMSSAGARGLLQLMPETARRTAARSGLAEFEDPEALFSPATNIALGAAYLDRLAGLFPTRLSAVIGSYNAGPTAVAAWLEGAAAELEDDVWVEDIPYGQTRAYVKRVLRSLHVYRNFY